MSNDTTGNDSANPTRRSVLKGIGASAVAGIAVTGTASAKPIAEMGRVEVAYDDAARARGVVAEHADPVLAELAANGVLARGDVAELDFDDLSVDALAKDGTPTAQLETTTDVDGGEVEVLVRPETGRAYATVRTDGDVYTVESAAGSDDVSTQDCYYEHRCTNLSCDTAGECVYQERECCDNLTQGEIGTSDYDCGNWYNDGCCLC